MCKSGNSLTRLWSRRRLARQGRPVNWSTWVRRSANEGTKYVSTDPAYIFYGLCRFGHFDNEKLKQGMVDDSASKPALRQDKGYLVEKTYLDIAPYLEAFGAYLMPQ